MALPPVLYVQGEKDMMHPRPDLDRFVAAYRKRGGEVDLALYPDEVEGFVVRNANGPNAPKPWSGSSRSCIATWADRSAPNSVTMSRSRGKRTHAEPGMSNTACKGTHGCRCR